MIDAPNGGGFLEIETASKTYSLRCGDSAVRLRPPAPASTPTPTRP